MALVSNYKNLCCNSSVSASRSFWYHLIHNRCLQNYRICWSTWSKQHMCFKYRLCLLCMPAWVLSHLWLFVTLWTIASHTPLSMGFYRKEHWSGLPFPPLGNLPAPRIEPMSLYLLHWQVGSVPLAPSKKPHSSLHLLYHPAKGLIQYSVAENKL